MKFLSDRNYSARNKQLKIISNVQFSLSQQNYSSTILYPNDFITDRVIL
jgi:hypothetical protein